MLTLVLALASLFAGASSFSMGSTVLSSSFLGSRSFVEPTAQPSSYSIGMISHGKGFKTLAKPADQRKALLRSLTTEIIRHGRIKTTLIRARAVRPFVDHMIKLSKNGSLHARRQVVHRT